MPSPLNAGPDHHERPALRVATWNLLWRPARREERTHEVIECLAQAGPDVICLQEVAVTDEDGTTTADVIADALGMHAYFVEHRNYDYRLGVAVLTRELAASVHELPLYPYAADAPGQLNAVAVRTHTPNGRPLLIASAHLAWGGHVEPQRQQMMLALDMQLAHLAQPDQALTVLGGDFNATADMDSVRYLTGRAAIAGQGTFWVDAWTTTRPDEPGETCSSRNALVRATARNRGITHPEDIPDRRIDYVMVRGWAYGRPGSPLTTDLIGHADRGPGHEPSDHYGVTAALWDPPQT